MTQKYYGLLTNVGLAKLAAAAAGGAPLALATMAFGDGGGAETAPGKTATALVNERYRAPVVEKYPHPTNPAILYVEGVIPSGIGGWTMREAGIFDAAGDLIVVAKPPAIDVALISEGASTEGIVRLPLVFESLDAVQLLIDPTVVLATQGWVLDRLLSRPFITVESITTSAPPAAPVSHSLYVVPAGATGAWAGQTHKLAYYQGGWSYRDSPVGKRIAASDTGSSWRRTATGWERLWVEPEIETLLAASGHAAPHGADARVTRAVRSQRINYVPAAGGTANALVVALDPPLTGRVPGMPLRVRIAAANTGAATLDAGYGPLPIVTKRGVAIARGDLPAGADMEVIDVGGAWMLAGIAYSEFRRRLTADATFYIRSDGNDGNLGLINSATGAFQTLAGAFARVSREYETTGFIVTFQLGMAGTYVGAALASAAGNWELVGSSWANAASYVIESPPGLPYTIYSELSDLRIRRCTLRTVYAGTPTIETGVQVANGGNILLDDVVVSQANNRAGYRDIYVNTRGAVRCLNRVQFGGAGSRFVSVECVNQGLFVASDNPAVPTQFFSSGTMSMTGVWCRVTMGGYANWTSCNLAGAAATGSRYYADTGGGIDTGGGGANFFPGNAGGTAVAATMGWYR